MAKTKFELNYAGVGELLKSPEMRSVIESYAAEASHRAGEGYNVKYGSNRVVAFVETGTDAAAQDNLDNNTLLKAVRKQ